MLKRTDKLLIGKDISRDNAVAAGADLATISASGGIASGEVVVLDKFKLVLTAGDTVVDTDSIFICQGTGETFDYTNEAGTLTSSNRKLLFSDKIEGAKVRKFIGRSYVVKAEQVSTLTVSGMTAVEGVEYVFRVVYKDIKEHPGQFTQTYRVIASAADAATLDTFTDSVAAKINSHKGRRVQATETATTIVLTGREQPESCSALTDIDKFSLTEFDFFPLEVNSDGNQIALASGITTNAVVTTGPTYGSGNWEQVRDLEKAYLGHIGISNKTIFPIVEPDMSTVVDDTYDFVVIEHNASYLAPNSQGFETTGLTTIVALKVESGGDQSTLLLAQLNPWMASLPGAFSNVSV